MKERKDGGCLNRDLCWNFFGLLAYLYDLEVTLVRTNGLKRR